METVVRVIAHASINLFLLLAFYYPELQQCIGKRFCTLCYFYFLHSCEPFPPFYVNERPVLSSDGEPGSLRLRRPMQLQ